MSLSERQISQLKARLRRRFDALREAVRQELVQADEEQYSELAGSVADPGDDSVADQLADMNLPVIDQHINEIRQVEAALMRIARGTYGVCVDCEEAIAPQRLRAYPVAERCYRCQSRLEEQPLQSRHASL